MRFPNRTNKRSRYRYEKPFLSLLTSLVVVCTGVHFSSSSAAEDAAKYSIEGASGGPKILRNGELLTQYLTLNGHKPILYPLIGPDSVELTRAYPIASTKDGEREDHVHHRSFWFTHGEVNGVDFWAEGDHCGRIIQTAMRANESEHGAVIRTENAWKSPSGDVVLTDVRELLFHDVDGKRVIDFDIVLKASEQDVVFGDTKEGSFGIRIAGTMKVDAKLGGTYVSDSGKRNADAWGKQAAWIDYTGPVDGETYGIAILNHPSSYGYPTRWHARTYGLFAANPFGVHHFVGGEKNRWREAGKGRVVNPEIPRGTARRYDPAGGHRQAVEDLLRASLILAVLCEAGTARPA